MPGLECLTDEQIDQLAAGALPSAEAAVLRGHLAGCSACREALEECRANLEFATSVRTAFSIDAASGVRPAATHRDEPQRAPTIVGYEIVRELHQGAQGVVYLGVQKATGRQVAIKFLLGAAGPSDPSRRRFEREIDLAARLEHPNIVRVFDSGVTASGRCYYVMDYVEGRPLHHDVWDRRLGLRDALELFVTVCDAVNFAHQRGVIHRDLKPSNILVDGQGVPHVLDFGLAKELLSPPETLLSITGQVVGTLPYMSPEQAGGSRDQVDIRTDVYALGVILYHLLTGCHPYPVTGAIPEVLQHICRTPPTPPRRAWSAECGVPLETGVATTQCPIDEEVETILLRALAKEPGRRYPNVVMLQDDVSRYLRGQPIEARRDIGLLALRRTLARYKAITTLAGTAILLAATFACTFWWMYQSQSRERERYEVERARAIEAQDKLAAAVRKLGDNAVAQGDLEDAAGQYLAALTIQEHLAASDLDNREYQESLGQTLLKVADLARLRGDVARSREYYRRLAVVAGQLAAAEPENPAYVSLLYAGHDGLRWATAASEGRPSTLPANEK